MERIIAAKLIGAMLVASMLVGCAGAVDRITALPTWDVNYQPPTTEKYGKIYKEIVSRIRNEWGFTLIDTREELDAFIIEHPEVKEIMTRANGVSSVPNRLIILEPSMAVDGKLEVLLHEVGHFFQSPTWNYENGNRNEAEVFAEFVSRKVGEYYGIRGLRQRSDTYLAAYKSGLYILPYFQADIKLAAESIVGRRKAPTFVNQQ